MNGDLRMQRRFFAEELQAACNLRLPRLVDAFAATPREAFLRPGPWTIRGEGDLSGPRQTLDANPRHVYHNVAVAIDPARQLYNGQPGTIGGWIDALGVNAGARVLHVGCGLGYYSAVLAHCVGAAGRVVAIEVDEALASEAAVNLASFSWVEVRRGNAGETFDEVFDAILVNAGVTHPQTAWLDALAADGRMVLPLTCSIPQMGTIGKGVVMVLANDADAASLNARPLSMVAIYSAVGIRSDALNERLGKRLMQPGSWMAVKKVRRDPHAETATCWFHADDFCFASA